MWNVPTIVRLTIAASLLGLSIGCQARAVETTPSPTNYYSGDVRQTATTSDGPLQLKIWRVTYESGASRTSDETTLVMEPKVTVYLRLHNAGRSTVVIRGDQNASVTGSPTPVPAPPLPAYYLTNDHGRRFRLKGMGWTRHEGEPAESVGKVLPGTTAEFTLSFEAISTEVDALTLVMENVTTEDGTQRTLRIHVPLPE